MKPYYQDDSVTIYHGNCRDILPSLSKVDLVLTDPPYGIGEARGKNKSRGHMAASKDYGMAEWDDVPIPWPVIEQCVSAGSKAIVFGGNFYPVPPSPCWLVWDKDNNNNDFADCELAWTNLKGAVRMITWRWNGMLQQDMKNKEYRWHPTQKPVALMKWCIVKAEPCETILDPFMGSGTTLVAAKALNKRAIGIEIEERYCEIAANRCRQTVMNLQ